MNRFPAVIVLILATSGTLQSYENERIKIPFESPLYDAKFPRDLIEILKNAPVKQRFDVHPGTRWRETILKTDKLVFHPGGTLSTASDNVRSGYLIVMARELIFQNGKQRGTIRPLGAGAPDGSPGRNGQNGRSWNRSRCGGRGRDATDGSNGSNGSDAPPAPPLPPIYLIIGEVVFETQSSSSSPTLSIDMRGHPGGTGGSGGDGGSGGNGERGKNPTSGPYGCLVEAGRGGRPGNGGRGGNGGDGGPGGAGGDVFIVGPTRFLDAAETWSITNDGGLPGDGGSAGRGGSAGQVGLGGCPKDLCREGPPGQRGKSGESGARGRSSTIRGLPGKTYVLEIVGSRIGAVTSGTGSSCYRRLSP